MSGPRFHVHNTNALVYSWQSINRSLSGMSRVNVWVFFLFFFAEPSRTTAAQRATVEKSTVHNKWPPKTRALVTDAGAFMDAIPCPTTRGRHSPLLLGTSTPGPLKSFRFLPPFAPSLTADTDLICETHVGSFCKREKNLEYPNVFCFVCPIWRVAGPSTTQGSNSDPGATLLIVLQNEHVNSVIHSWSFCK